MLKNTLKTYPLSLLKNDDNKLVFVHLPRKL